MINWNWCDDLNQINEAIASEDANWEGLNDASQIISVAYDGRHGSYLVIWRV